MIAPFFYSVGLVVVVSVIVDSVLIVELDSTEGSGMLLVGIVASGTVGIVMGVDSFVGVVALLLLRLPQAARERVKTSASAIAAFFFIKLPPD